MEILIKAGQFLLSLSFLIVLHELGHFIPARLFKTRVEKFFLFFDVKGALFQRKIGETVYGIGWLPLGGYVKIAGMIDESMDKEQLAKPPQPWEFRSKPAWQRLIIMLGGVTVNLILGVLIYSMVLFVWGDKDLRIDRLPYGLSFVEPLQEAGFQNDDVVISLQGEPVQRLDDFRSVVFGTQVTKATVIRNGVEEELNFQTELGQVLLNNAEAVPKGTSPINVNLPAIVEQVSPKSGAEAAGLQRGDQILSVAGIATPYFQSVVKILSQFKGQENVSIGVRHNVLAQNVDRIAQPLPADAEIEYLSASVDQDGKLGFFPVSYEELGVYEFEEHTFGPIEALAGGAEKATNTLTGYVSSLRFLFRPGGSKQLGGFITLGSIFSPEWNWESFWNITALLSIILAFMNLLPIPALDGGHVMFLLYEMVSGRKPGEKFMEFSQLAGLLFILALMALANGNDLWKWVSGQW